MAGLPDPGPNRRRLLWAVLVMSALLRLWLAWGFLGFVTGDDVEVLEAGFHGAVELDYRPWEIRSLLMPEIVVRPAVEAAALLGVESAGGRVRAALLPFVLLGALGTWLVFRLGELWARDARVGLLAAALHAFHPLVLGYGSTALPRVPAATAVVAAALLMSGGRKGLARGVAAGTLVAFAVSCRYSEATLLVPLALLGSFAARGGADRWRRLLGLAAGFVLATALALGLFDLLSWGSPFASLREFARYTLVEQQASAEVARQPLHWYLRRLPHWLPLSLLPLLWFVPRRRRSAPLWAFVLWPLLVLSLIHHKDLRYLQAVLPFVALLAAMGGVALYDRGRRRTAVALVAVTVAYGAVDAYRLAGRRSLAAVAAAQRLADEADARDLVLSQAWAWGNRLFLGNDVALGDLPVRPSAAELEAALASPDRVGLYLEDLEASPELEAVLRRGGFSRREIVRRGRSKAVVLHGPGDAAPRR